MAINDLSPITEPFGKINRDLYRNATINTYNPFKLQDCIVRDMSVIKASEGYRLFKTRNFLKIERI